MFRQHRLLFTLLALAAALGLAVMFGCSSDDDNPTDPGGGNGGTDNAGSVSGIVMHSSGFPLSDVTVTTGTQTTTTNESGYFVLTAVPEGTRLVGFARTDFMATFRVADVVEGRTVHFADVVMTPVETATVNGAAGGQVATGDGDGAVDFPADAFVDGAGAPYTGDVTVELNAMLPDDADFYGTFPGEFVGTRENGDEVPFVSYGFMSVQMMGADKAPLRLADGVTAALSLTIPEEKAMTAPATIPMWYFDEATGQWMEEGEATLVGNVYTADVAHFTTWNWDLPVADICSITGTVVNGDGDPVVGARVLSRGVDVAIMDEVVSGANGSFTVRAVRNSATDVWAISGSRASEAIRVNVGETCPYVLETPLVLQVAAYSISLTWGASPSDLDSHLYIPMTWDEDFDYYHIAYYNMGDYGSDPYAGLDTDDTSSYGPEVITGTRLYQGRFQYWVHNYSQDTNSGLQSSGAVIQLEVGGGLYIYEAADAPLDGGTEGGWLHVCDFVVSGGTVTVESVLRFQAEPTGAGIYPAKKASQAK
ncbi:MAG: carboxypeptidase-like regulatory domain-containing protein [Candidatus Krumholzibacteriia bacterium]